MVDPTPHEDGSTQHVSRRLAAKQLASRHHVRASFGLMPQAGLRNSILAGIQAALALIIALPLITLSPYAHLVGFAALGSLCALFARFAPKQQRLRILAECCILQTSAVALMSFIGWAGASEAMKLLALAICLSLIHI